LILFFCGSALAERLAVSVSVANIRSGPGTKGYDVLWRAEQYYPIEVLTKKGEWYQFKDFEGDKGWVHKSLVGDIPSVITNRDECNFRSGPGTGPEYRVLFVIEKGVPFKILEKKGDWLHVQHGDGDKGWIHKSLVW
jgi:SH3-like domain-containing protein